MISAQNITRKMKAEANNLGFSLVGVTLPESPPHIEAYKSWVSAGYFADMSYLASDSAIFRRTEPTSNLIGCKSIILLGLPYPGPLLFSKPPGDLPRGRISAYAWGKDYHTIAIRKANHLASYLTILVPNSKHHIYVDTGPILERDLAQMAGLGWIGKNTCLISPQTGSYVFLVEVFTDVPLEPDTPFMADRCGTCQKCIQICPTNCILPNRTINASRCISYLTIENKNTIPEYLRAATGNWIFGCDLCQIICPWNSKHNAQAGDFDFSPDPAHAYPDLLSELTLTSRQFNSKYSGTPLTRARRNRYLRNVATALGNQPDPGYLPQITDAIVKEEIPLVRIHLYWALARTGAHKARMALEKFFKTETDPACLLELKQHLEFQT